MIKNYTFIVNKEFINKHDIVINKDFIYIGVLTNEEITKLTNNIKVLHEVITTLNGVCIIVI